MKKLIVLSLLAGLYGCGPSEPSLSEIERGMQSSFIQRTGAFSAKLDAHAQKIGKGRWSVSMSIDQGGFRRTLNATAVMDKNGDVHYYTD